MGNKCKYTNIRIEDSENTRCDKFIFDSIYGTNTKGNGCWCCKNWVVND